MPPHRGGAVRERPIPLTAPTSSPTDPRVPWGLVCAGTALIGTCYGFARFAYGLFAPEFQATFGIGRAVAGVIGAGSYVGYCVAIVVSLVLTERLGARRLAVSAGVVATVGTAIVASAPSAAVLAVGVLIAGSSTGLASPPMAAAVSRWVQTRVRDRAQTIVNAGTGIGVLVSGPIALVLFDRWRWAWAVFAVLAAAVTVWVHLTVPSTPSEAAGDAGPRGYVPGTGLMVVGAFLMGMSSAAVWVFGRDLVTTVGDAGGLVSSCMWTVIGAAGVIGALGGDLVARVGIARSWTSVMVAMAAATVLLALAPASTVAVFSSATLFGASYIILTAVLLLWSLRIYPDRSAFGVGLSFLMIAVGQSVGAPLAGVVTDAAGPSAGFLTCAVLGLLGALVRPAAAQQHLTGTPADRRVGDPGPRP